MRRRLAIVILLAAAGILAAVAAAKFGGLRAPSGGSTPPAPVIRRHPSDPTTSTRAHFTYTDAVKRVTFRCRLDAGRYVRCGAAKNYTRLAPGRHTFCVRAVARAGRTSAPACWSWTIGPAGAAASVRFTIAGEPLTGSLLYPGGPDVPINLVLTNPNPVAITVTSVTTTVGGTGASGCRAADFVVARQLSAAPVVPAGATRSLQQLGIAQPRWPALRMLDNGDQDACQDARIALVFDGLAEGS